MEANIKNMTCQENVPHAVDAGFNFIMANKQEGKYAWCLCVERRQLSSISDETARCGGHKNLNELYAILQSCYRHRATWRD